MAHKYPNVLIHCVFSTKERKNTIPQPLLPTLFNYLNGIGRNVRVPVLVAGGTANHLHMLIALPSDVPLAKAIQIFKANSSRWLGEQGINFAWQEGYGAFSVSASNREIVQKYRASDRTSREAFFRRRIRHLVEKIWGDLRSRAGVRVVPSLRDSVLALLPFPALTCRAFLFRPFGTGAGFTRWSCGTP